MAIRVAETVQSLPNNNPKPEISSIHVVVKVLKRALKTQRFLLIVAEDAESETLAILSLN